MRDRDRFITRVIAKEPLVRFLFGHTYHAAFFLLRRYIHRRFTETVTTIGASFFLRRHKGKNFALWDTAGEERFSGLSALYSRDASAAILAYDVTCADSFASLKTRFLPMLSSAKDHCIYVVVGTKLDLAQPSGTPLGRYFSSADISIPVIALK